jgi:type VI secretion system protein ImpA
MNASLEALSQPISEEAPSGDNLEYDPQFLEMQTLFWPKSESMVEGDDDADNEPDWKGVVKNATALLENTRDIRVLVHSCIASIHTSGLPEFRDHLILLKTYLDEFWDSVHPQLDPEDDNDPTERLSALQMLDEHSLIGMGLERVKLVELKGMGQYSARDVEVAQGKEAPDKEGEVPDINAIRQAFLMSEPEHLESLRSAADESIALLKDMCEVWSEKTGGQWEPVNFDNAQKALKHLGAIIDEYSPTAADDEDGEGEGAGGEGGAPAASGAVRNRADVVRVLDRICEYYSVNEPSSPIPLLLRRAQRLVEKSFMEILEDMVPDGVSQAKVVSGDKDEEAY